MKTFKDIFDLFGLGNNSKNDKKQKVTPLNDTEKALADFSCDDTDDLAAYVQKRRSDIQAEKNIEAQMIEDKRIEEITSMDLPTDFENLYAMDERATGIHTESINDGLVISLSNLARVDIEYIAQITGKTLKEVSWSMARYLPYLLRLQIKNLLSKMPNLTLSI